MERYFVLETGSATAAQALEKIDELFDPVVSFRALTCAPLASQPGDDDWPDTEHVYYLLSQAAEEIGGNSPDITFGPTGNIFSITYISRSGNSRLDWSGGEYTIAVNRHSSLLRHLLGGQDCTEVLTEESGYCYLHRPSTSENPENCWVFAPEGGGWCHRYTSLDELVQAEAGDWQKIA